MIFIWIFCSNKIFVIRAHHVNPWRFCLCHAIIFHCSNIMGPSKQRCNIWSTAGSLTLEIVLPNKEKQLINKDGYLPSCWNSLFRLISLLQCLDWVRPRRLEATSWRNKCTELFIGLFVNDQEKESELEHGQNSLADNKKHYQIILLRARSDPFID